MSTDGNLPDLKFPQTGGQGNAIRLSASTLKQHGRNGELAGLRCRGDGGTLNLLPFRVFSGYFQIEAVLRMTFPSSFRPENGRLAAFLFPASR